MAILSLVLGIVALFIGLVPCLGVWFAVPLAFVGLVLGVIALFMAGTPDANGNPKPRGMAIAGTGMSIVALLVSVAWFLTQAAAVGAASEQAAREQATKAAATQSDLANAEQVDLATLLSEYKENEVRADARFKGRFISVTGNVDEVKKDLLGSVYVLVGTNKRFEIPQVQCSIARGHEAATVSLSRGQTVKVAGRAEGLMLNVHLADCVIQ